MVFSAFFIKRPRFAIVISIVMVLLGLMALAVLPIAQYPEITPPQIVVSANYPGASAKTLVETVAIPIENQINGVEDMLYMESSSDDNGSYTLTITFNIGTDPDMAQVKVENRLQQVNAELPEVVTKEGLSVKTQSANILAMAVLRSPNRTYTDLFLSNYAYENLKNPLGRIKGISEVDVYGPQDSMRIWLNPTKMASLGISSQDVVKAIESQNIQASIGAIGSAPSEKNNEIVLFLSAKGLLSKVEDFDDIIITTSQNGGIVYLKDISHTEIGADNYTISANFNNSPAVVLGFSQTPNSNALDIMKELKKQMDDLSKTFPEDMKLEIAYDSTTFVKASIESIVETLFITFLLVVLVVFIFLQNPKATLIPTITIPVSLIATFIVIYLLGYNLNILTLFAMILAIGLVVDDAIVVVERAEYLMLNEKLDSTTAAIKAMEQISGAVVATTFVLLSIFIPVGLMAGITGKIYQQFAVTIATAVVFSSINALTLSPALCAIFLEKKKSSSIKIFSYIFNYINKLLDFLKEKYLNGVTFLCKHLLLTIVMILLVIGCIGYLFFIAPSAFIPSEDQGLIFGNLQLPQTASINRTKKVLSQMGEKILNMDGVNYFISIAGASMLGGGGENIALVVAGLNPWKERNTKVLALSSIMEKLQSEFNDLSGASVDFYALPAIPGVGNSDGLSFDVIALNQDMTSDVFYQMLSDFLYKVNTNDNFSYAFSTYQSDTPHLYLDVNRTKLKSYNVPVSSFFETLQNNLGSSYVNNITMSGQVNKVIVQADYNYRKSIDDILNLYVFSSSGTPVQVRNFVNIKTVLSPNILYRHNQYMSASVIGATKGNVSTGTAIDEIEQIAQNTIASQQGSIAWTGLSLQEKQTGGVALLLIGLAVIFGYLFLVALYESFLVALSVMFSNVFAVLGALVGLKILNLPLSIYAQLGLVLLIGLASKNAILIVEFILDYRQQGMDIVDASVKGASERFRAVLMTALTFILGVFPMVIATGAGSASQRAIGTTVFFGMLIATLIGILFIPALFAVFDSLILPKNEEHGKGEKK